MDNEIKEETEDFRRVDYSSLDDGSGSAQPTEMVPEEYVQCGSGEVDEYVD